jgi:Type II secretory pathway, pullulanase PulA and related glycosidases
MELLLFHSEKDEQPDIITLSAVEYRSGYYWHVYVTGVTAGQLYAWRVKEVLVALPGNRFDPAKVLLDPYGQRIVLSGNYDRQLSKTWQ